MTTAKILFIFDDKSKMLFDGIKFHDIGSSSIKEYYSATALSSTEIKTHGFMIAKSASEQKIEIQAEMKMFDEVNLDAEVDYEISSHTIPLQNSEENYIESYAVESLKLEEKFGETAKELKQIDLIFPSYLSYIALYSFEHLEKKSDLFIHFGDEQSYAVIFKDGEYISSRALPSIAEIADKVGVHLEDMKAMLGAKGLDSSLYSDAEFIQMGNTEDELTKIVEKISHTVGHKRGVFKLEGLDRIYLDFEGGDIPGFLDLFESFGYESATKEILEIFTEVEAGMKHSALNALYALGDIQQKHKVPNLTIFERKPSFFKSHFGQFSLVLLLSILIGAAFPIYAMFVIEDLTTKENALKGQVAKLDENTKRLKSELDEIKAQKELAQKELDDRSKKLHTYSKTVDALLGFDHNALERQKIFKEVNIAMRKHRLLSRDINYSEDGMLVVEIISKYDQRDTISKFIKDLLRQEYSYAGTNKVERFENHYESFVEIRK